MTRARDLGIPLEGTPGPLNAITDVQGLTVGFATVIKGASARTGVTVIHPRGQTTHDPVFAGTFAFNGSGDIFLAFSTANPNAGRGDEKGLATLQALSNDRLDPLFYAAVYATEEAILNAMIAAKTMTGRDGITGKALPHEKLKEVMRRYGRGGQ